MKPGGWVDATDTYGVTDELLQTIGVLLVYIYRVCTVNVGLMLDRRVIY